MWISVSNAGEFPGAGLSRLITINSELNGASVNVKGGFFSESAMCFLNLQVSKK